MSRPTSSAASVPRHRGSGALSSEWAEEFGDVAGEELGFLVRGEVPAAGHPGVPGDVVGALGPRAWGAGEVGWEDGDGGGDLDPFDASGQAMRVFVVGPERRRDGAGEPVERRLGQDEVVGESGRQVAVVVAPGAVLLDD